MGQIEKRMIRECYLRHKELPERIKNAPDLLMGLELPFNAFVELTSCRSTGWQAGPIPSWCIDEFCARIELSPDEAEDLHFHVRAMDAAFLKHMARKSKESA